MTTFFFGDFSETISEIKPHLSGSFYKKNLAFSLCHLKKEYSEKRAELLKACLYRHFVNEQEI